MRFLHIFLLTFVTSTLVSCHFFHDQHIQGDGNVISQNRAITGFNSVDVSSAIELFVTQDSAYAVKVETDNNLQSFVEVYKEGDVLNVHQQNNTSLEPTGGSVKVYVSAPLFKEMQASGACTIKGMNKITSSESLNVSLSGASNVIMDVSAPNVVLDLSGASHVDLRGQTKDLSIEGSGSSNIDAFNLLSENANISLSGAGNADVHASVKLEAHASGAANINYKGNPTVNSNTSGAGSVKKAN